jgi:hypothetical protein
MANSRKRLLPTAACSVLLLLAGLQMACGGAAGNSNPPPVPLVPSVTVTAPVLSVAVNGSVQFSATVQNSTMGVLWQVNGVAGGNSTVGTLSASGFYVAPAAVPNPAIVTVAALLQSDTSIARSAYPLRRAASQ